MPDQPTTPQLAGCDTVRHDGQGGVVVGETANRFGMSAGGVVIAPRPRFTSAFERVTTAVRERTPDDWWRWAAEIHAATADLGTGGPLGAGVDFFVDEADTAIPPEVRAEIEEDAYEAARAAITEGIAAHLRRMIPVVRAITNCGGAGANTDTQPDRIGPECPVSNADTDTKAAT